MINLADAKPGFHVWYGRRSNPEYGIIVRANEKFVFVAFNGQPTPAACHPRDLYWPPAFCAFDGSYPPGQKYES